MNIIETWEALDRAIAIAAILAEHRGRLDEYRDTYDLEDLARFVILEPGETIETLVPPEYVTEHVGFKESVHIYSDDGFGLVVLTQTGERLAPPNAVAP